MEFVSSAPGADPIVVDALLDASPADVFRSWTDPNLVKRWFGPAPNTLVSATIDLQVGGAWRFLEHEAGEQCSGFEGTYIVIEPTRQLIFTWIKFVVNAAGERSSTRPSRVEINLTAYGTGTKLQVIHSGIVDDNVRHGFTHGWNRGINEMVALFAKPPIPPGA